MSCSLGPADMHAGGLQMGSDAGSHLTTWKNKAEKACPERKAAISALVELLKGCFKSTDRRTKMSEVADCLGKIQQSCK